MRRNLNQTLAHGRICGIPQTGVLGINVPRTGTNGGSYLAASLTEADDAVEVSGYINTFPSGEMLANEDGSFTYDGDTSSFTWTLYRFAVSQGSTTDPIIMDGGGEEGEVVGSVADIKYQKLATLRGYRGAMNDMINENTYFRALWAQAGTLPINDVKKHVFIGLGYSGSLGDMEKKYWESL